MVAAFDAGGADYVTKPIRPQGGAGPHRRPHAERPPDASGPQRPDAFGQATLAVQPETGWLVADAAGPQAAGRIPSASTTTRPQAVRAWIAESAKARRDGYAFPPLTSAMAPSGLVFTLHERAGEDEWLLALREGIRHRGDRSPVGRLPPHPPARPRCSTGSSRARPAPDIGEILGSSPRTVNKHLEHVFAKLGVENRTAAASVAMARIRMGGGEGWGHD